MSGEYVIQWRSKVNGRIGRGSKSFPKAEAERLATELNEEYPDIHHEPLALEQLPPPEGVKEDLAA